MYLSVCVYTDARTRCPSTRGGMGGGGGGQRVGCGVVVRVGGCRDWDVPFVSVWARKVCACSRRAHEMARNGAASLRNAREKGLSAKDSSLSHLDRFPFLCSSTTWARQCPVTIWERLRKRHGSEGTRFWSSHFGFSFFCPSAQRHWHVSVSSQSKCGAKNWR